MQSNIRQSDKEGGLYLTLVPSETTDFATLVGVDKAAFLADDRPTDKASQRPPLLQLYDNHHRS